VSDKQHTINVHWNDCAYDPCYHAAFDGYCGAPDSDHTFGRGDTPRDAILDLIENCHDEELGSWEK
jgi:hypothetical protein